jgi:uncharacterized protein (DUF2141 family)
MEQVQVRGIVCRGMRLKLVAALSIALATPALAIAAENAPRLTTQTAMTVETHDLKGRTQALVAVSVTGEDGLPATGAVAISDRGTQLAGAALNAEGQASLTISLPAGDHSLLAVYNGDATHEGSLSVRAEATGQTSSAPGFNISASPATLTLIPGASGTVTVSVTPVNSAALTAPLFVTLSCSGLPDEASCTFTPENIEIQPNQTAAINVPMVIGTQAAGGATASSKRPVSSSVAWAFLLPGALGLCGLAWSVRRRPWLNRLALVCLVGLVTLLGTTACNPRYDYRNHGPPPPPATPAGTYTVNITGQSSNGVTAITNPPVTIALTVQ